MWVAGCIELYIHIVLLINYVLYAVVASHQPTLHLSEFK